MIQKILIGVGILIAVTILTGYLFQDRLILMLMASQISPVEDFDAAAAPAAPDYTEDQAWAALPTRSDSADARPSGLDSADLDTQPMAVATFFVHPTSYFGKENWNQPLDHEDANWVVNERVLRHQASVFNGCCAVYAPRYRQATFFSFMDQDGNGIAALDLAYDDVARAFDQFLRAIDRAPFILAGHSQGTSHAARLLRERIADTPLQDRLVAAYLIGFSIEKDQTGGVPACDHAVATGCVVGWNTVEGTSTGLFPDADALICTNPLTWEDDGSYAGHDLNLGGIGYPTYGRPENDEDYTLMNVEVGAADAECSNGMLTIPELRSESFPSRMPGGSMHIYDYSLFYLNLRQNALRRAAAFLKNR